MKKYIKLSLFVLLLCSMGCSGSQSNGNAKQQENVPAGASGEEAMNQETIIGTWKVTKREVDGKLTNQNDILIFNFLANGTFILTVNNSRIVGDWNAFEDETLAISFYDKEYEPIKGSFEIKDKKLLIKGHDSRNDPIHFELIKAKGSGR